MTAGIPVSVIDANTRGGLALVSWTTEGSIKEGTKRWAQEHRDAPELADWLIRGLPTNR